MGRHSGVRTEGEFTTEGRRHEGRQNGASRLAYLQLRVSVPPMKTAQRGLTAATKRGDVRLALTRRSAPTCPTAWARCTGSAVRPRPLANSAFLSTAFHKYGDVFSVR